MQIGRIERCLERCQALRGTLGRRDIARGKLNLDTGRENLRSAPTVSAVV